MRLRDVLLTAVLIVTSLGLVVASALTDLRSPERTAALGASLADDPDVQDAVVEAVVDALIDDAAQRSPLVAVIVGPLRGVLTATVDAAIGTPVGRSLLASALTDALRQLTFPGPVVIDLRTAVLAIADDAPPPLDAFARLAVEQGAVGLIVLGGGGEDDDPTAVQAELSPPSEEQLRSVGGLPAGLAIRLLALMLVVVLIALVGRRERGRAVRIVVASTVLLAVGGATLLLLGPVAAALTSAGMGSVTDDAAFASALQVLLDGIVGLLDRTAALARTLTAAGVVGSVAGLVIGFATMARGSRTGDVERLADGGTR